MMIIDSEIKSYIIKISRCIISSIIQWSTMEVTVNILRLTMYGQMVKWSYFYLINQNTMPARDCPSFKVIRQFFFKTLNQSFSWNLGDYEKHIFFSPFEGL